MSRLVQEVEKAIALARRSRRRALKILDAIEDTRGLIARAEKPAIVIRIAIALPSLTRWEPATARALNLNRRPLER